ncbi:hypothetical protein KAT36_04910 [Candidatus Pacearchaeota archaeon]|nr:hypothetical protein [Candidatus Pacearchaeota archaeon]
MELKSVDIEKKLKRRDFLEEIKRASNEKYVTEWDDEGRIGVQKKKSNVECGSMSKSSGGTFELRVRKDLERKGWIVDKWSNNLNLDEDKIVSAKRRFRKFNANIGVMTIGTGFPDFVCFQKIKDGLYKVIGVEVKMNGKLSREEKEKCVWYLENKVFAEILVARKVKEGGRVRIEYEDTGKILGRMRSKG